VRVGEHGQGSGAGGEWVSRTAGGRPGTAHGCGRFIASMPGTGTMAAASKTFRRTKVRPQSLKFSQRCVWFEGVVN